MQMYWQLLTIKGKSARAVNHPPSSWKPTVYKQTSDLRDETACLRKLLKWNEFPR